MKFRILGVLLIAFATLSAQTTGTLKIYISPPPETIMIDETELKFGNTADLPPGKYFLKAWAPDKALLDTIVEIKAGQVTSFFYRLQPSGEYQAHLQQLSKYSNKRTKHFVLPATTTAIVAGGLVFTYLQGNKVRSEALEAYETYKYAYTDNQIEETKAEYERLQSKYKGYVTAYYVEWGALAISSYFLYKGVKWIKKNKRPPYKEPKNPLALNTMGISRDVYGNFTLGLTFNIK